MADVKINISPKLKEDLKTYATAACVGLAAKTRDIMYEEAKTAIAMFYASYDPVRYKRHYTNFENNSFQKYYSNPHNSIVRGGVELTPDNLDDIYKIDANYIFKLVYTGHHGNAGAFPQSISNMPPVTEAPLQMLLDMRSAIVNNIGNYKGYAMDAASKKSYSVIKV